jgi:predicted hydrocarbon binding protein
MVSSFLKKLMFARQFDIDEGKITVLGEQQIMLPADLLLALQEIDPKRTYEFTKQQTSKMIENYFTRIGTSFTRSDSVVCDIFNNFGLGKMHILENTEAVTVIKITDSTMAQDYIKRNSDFTDRCVCHVTSGVLAGMFSFLKKKEVNSEEKECHAKRDSSCKFVIS